MPRTPWTFGSYTFPVNPEEDSGWVYEVQYSNKVPIGAPRSTIQYTGTRSPTRKISGWIFGENAQNQYNTMLSWIQNRTQAVLTDHTGNARLALLIEFTPQSVNDAKQWSQGRQVWKYTATFLGL